MSIHHDLLEQAEFLANKEPRRPKQASLRRAVSTACYAVFHLIVEDAANTMSPAAPAGLRSFVRRSFQHNLIKATCIDFIRADSAMTRSRQSSLLLAVEEMLAFPLEADLVVVMTAFVELQEARHKADYDLTGRWNRSNVLDRMLLARKAYSSWTKVRRKQNASVFMASLLIGKGRGK